MAGSEFDQIVQGLFDHSVMWYQLSGNQQDYLRQYYPSNFVNDWIVYAQQHPSQEQDYLNQIQDILKQQQQQSGPKPPFFVDMYGNPYTKEGYHQMLGQYKHLGDIYGVSISDAQAQFAIKNGIDANEFRQRLATDSWIKNNDQLKNYINSLPGIDGKIKTYNDWANFVMGQGEKSFYDIYGSVAAGYAAQQAGIGLPGGQQNANERLNWTQKELDSLTKGMSPDQIDPAQLQQTASQAAQALLDQGAANAYKGYKLSEQDFIDIAKGAGTPEKQATLLRLYNEEKAFNANGSTTVGRPNQNAYAGL